MAYDLEEQEQIDQLAAWWKKRGSAVIACCSVLLLAFAGYKSWQYYTHKQALEASNLYAQLLATDPVKDLSMVRKLSGELVDKNAITPYAARAALFAAKANYTAGDFKSAIAQLEWAIKYAREPEISALARLQLAALQLQEKHPEEALKTLDREHTAGFEGLFSDLRGDILLAQGKKSDAAKAYRQALEQLDASGRYRHYTERKLDALGI